MAHAEHDEHDDGHEAGAAHHEAPPPAEPETPLWFTMLGVGLFVMGALFLLFRQGEKDAIALAAASASAKPAAAPAAPTATAALPSNVRLPMPKP